MTRLHMTPDRNRLNDSLDATRLASGTRSVPRGRRMQRSIFSILALTLLSQICSPGQQSDAPQHANDVTADHVLWIIPNFRTMSLPMPYRPVSAREKFQIATKDSFDRGTVGLVAVFAADGLATNSHKSFGQGSVGYAVGQIFVSYTDSGEKQFHFAEFCGHSAAVATSMAYYPENRRASDAVSKLSLQIALGAAGNILKEFWPERRPHRDSQRGGKDAGATN